MVTATRAIVSKSVRYAMPRDGGSAAEEHATSTALTRVEPVEWSESVRFFGQRPAAPFLAQLIATSQMAPQTRTLNRVKPREAIAAYGDAKRMLKRRSA
ncbi:MAG: hypothetical protein ACXWJ6_15350 [Xanthobacteraceae bacterium]